MRFFLDHDVPADVARVLRAEGHDVTELREVADIRMSDRDAFALAAELGMLMVTCNRDDFLRPARTEPHVGLIILVRRRTRQAECAHILRLIDRAGEAGFAGNINFA